jgi:hypothetical protein
VGWSGHRVGQRMANAAQGTVRDIQQVCRLP